MQVLHLHTVLAVAVGTGSPGSDASAYEILSSVSMPPTGELLLIGAASLVLLGFFYRLGFSSPLGMLLTGIVVGSLELTVLMHDNLLHGLAEAGAVFLLLITSARFRYAVVTRQVRAVRIACLYTALAVSLITLICWNTGLPWQVAIFSALLLTFTGCPVVARLTGSSGPNGRPMKLLEGLGIGQVVVVLLVLPLLSLLSSGHTDLQQVVKTYLTGLPPIVVAFILAGSWFPQQMKEIQRDHSREIALAKIGGIACLPFLFTALLGLPMAFGAVTTGILISETRIRGQHLHDRVTPRWIVAALFFVPLGMMFDYELLVQKLNLITWTLAAVLLLKIALLGAILYATVQMRRYHFQLGLHLLPLGALSFLVFSEGRALGLLPGGLGGTGEELFITVTVILFIIHGSASGLIAKTTIFARERSTDRKRKRVPGTVPAPTGQLSRLITDCGAAAPSTRNRRYTKSLDQLFDERGPFVPVLIVEGPIFIWDIPVDPGATAEERAVGAICAHAHFNMRLIGLWRKDVYIVDPPKTLTIRSGDRVVVSGTPQAFLYATSLFLTGDRNDTDAQLGPPRI